MRLINCDTLELEEFFGSNIPPYAILSHTWGSDEVTFAHIPLNKPSATTRTGYGKIIGACAQAQHDGLRYAWVDTCCIDKSSSAELSEAINSMYAWYKSSIVCYAFLEDVSKSKLKSKFRRSRWFTRGWTLQELIAPQSLVFYDQEWVEIGDRSSHAVEISNITGIDLSVIQKGSGKSVQDCCIAQRMSWASTRRTTRVEDEAYCLLGIFDINMPLLYGEGQRAFLRLQEEIMKVVDDDSILAWGFNPRTTFSSDMITIEEIGTSNPRGPLAPSPLEFKDCGDLQIFTNAAAPFSMTNVGLQIRLPLIRVSTPDNAQKRPSTWVALLRCSLGTSLGFQTLGILLSEPYEYREERREALEDARSGNLVKILISSDEQNSRSQGYLPDRLVRTSYWLDERDCFTILMSSTMALEYQLETVTISRQMERRTCITLGYDHCYHLKLPTKDSAMEYHVVSASAWHLAERWGLSNREPKGPRMVSMLFEHWDENSGYYTCLGKPDLMAFVVAFADAYVTIFMALKQTELSRVREGSIAYSLIRKGSVLPNTHDELNRIYELIMTNDRRTARPQTATTRIGGKEIQVYIYIKTGKSFHQWQMSVVYLSIHKKKGHPRRKRNKYR